jgi:hypothetical protein
MGGLRAISKTVFTHTGALVSRHADGTSSQAPGNLTDKLLTKMIKGPTAVSSDQALDLLLR